MPNWCYNTLTVEGPTEELDRFVEAVATDEASKSSEYITSVDLAQIHPTPEDLNIRSVIYSNPEEGTPEHAEWLDLQAKYKVNIEKYGYATWYDWNIANWSVKWAPNITEFERYSHGIVINYETPWGPATDLIRKISEVFPTLVFSVTMTEESNAFVGCEVFHQGNLYDHGYDLSNPSELPDEYRSEIESAEARISASDGADDDYWSAYETLRDLLESLNEYCERIAHEKFILAKQTA